MQSTTTPRQLRASARELLKKAAQLRKTLEKETARLRKEADARLKAADEIDRTRQLGHADAPTIEKRYGHLRSRPRARR